MEQVWATADEHFGHHNIIDFCHRPFKDIYEMREKLISNHNEVVKPGDRVFHVGDMFWRTLINKEALDIRYRLNGQHFYIFGNHDEVFHRSEQVRSSFIWCKERFNLNIKGYPNIVLDHYAGRTWLGSHRGSWQLYGHSHGELHEFKQGEHHDDSNFQLDVGVDCWNYYPVNLDQIKEKMISKGWND